MSLDAYARHVARSHPVHRIDGLPWRIKNRILEPIAPPHRLLVPDRAKVRQVLAGSNALLARWNEGWDTAPCAWWWICCDDPDYDVERLSRRGRRGARRGLERCAVSRVDAACLRDQGYAVYAAAHARYPEHVRPAPEAVFVGEIDKAEESGSYENWGCFLEGRLAAYARCIRVGDVVIVSEVKSDPAALAARPNNALIVALTWSYMRSGGIRYVTDGSRAVHHETQFQDFLEELGFRRIYCPLRVMMAPLLAAAVHARVLAVARRARVCRLMPRLGRNIEAVAALWSIARECRPIQAPTP